MAKYLDDILIIAGCGVIVFTVAQLSLIAAGIVAGVFLMAGGIAIGLANYRRQP